MKKTDEFTIVAQAICAVSATDVHIKVVTDIRPGGEDYAVKLKRNQFIAITIYEEIPKKIRRK